MADAVERAKYFLEQERAFRLGELLTESYHPKTVRLSQTIQEDTAAGIRLLQSVDEDIPPAMEKVFEREEYHRLVEGFGRALRAGRAVFITALSTLFIAWRPITNHMKIIVRGDCYYIHIRMLT